MVDEIIANVSITCNACGKDHAQVRKLILLVHWDRKQIAICSDCVLDCATIMIHQDREWFERQIEEIKAHPPSPQEG